MSQIKRFSESVQIPFVAFRNACLAPNARSRDRTEKVKVEKLVGIVRKPSVNLFVERTVLYYFAESAPYFAFGKGFKKTRVDDNFFGLIERAYQIFYFFEVDSRLSADGAVNLLQ